jgi:serine/threonine protein kinase
MMHYTIKRRLGKGTYGQVFEVSRAGQRFAMKNIHYSPTDEYLNLFFREISILKSLNHPGIIEILDVVTPSQNKSFVSLISALMDSDLKTYVRQNFQDRKLPMDILQPVFSQIVHAVAYCHAQCVWHRDLKPHNILINWKTNEIKLADFGLAKFIVSRDLNAKNNLTHEIQTLWYRAVEVLLGNNHYDQSVDIWSIGTVLFELYAGKPLFPAQSEVAVLMQIFSLMGTPTESNCPGCSGWASYSSLFPAWSEQGARDRIIQRCNREEDRIIPELIFWMLQINPEMRPSAATLTKQEWIIQTCN